VPGEGILRRAAHLQRLERDFAVFVVD
jgi:hypothetical protein